jgi:hypothetical protein
MPARDKERLPILGSIFRNTIYKCICEAEDIFSTSSASVVDIQKTDLITVAAIPSMSEPSHGIDNK